ncbi:MAG: CHASE2 domain-containing protein, partial [Chitinophagia bacterium]|nr:CHASE2 domain-containing protein [Chitinophagia bacterium]
MFTALIKSKAGWLLGRIKSAPLYLRTTILTVAIGGLVSLQLFTLFGDQTAIDQRIVFPYLFNIREQLNPRRIDPRIKIFALDDQTYGYLKGDDISLPDWAKLFSAISKTPNVTIFIDKLFSKFYSDDDIKEFEKIMDEGKPHLNIIAFSYQDQIRFRAPISSELVEKKTDRFVEISTDLKSKLGPSSYQIYGTTPRILEKVTRFGHAEYPGTGRVLALRSVQSNLMVPFAGLTVAQKIQVTENAVFVNGQDIHVDSNGEIVVNFAPQKETNKNAYALMGAIARVKRNLELSVINPGDIVVILPAMYTGNTDFKTTPFGNMPGGLILASVMDSVLGGKWINYIQDPGFFILIPGVLMFIFGCFMPP